MKNKHWLLAAIGMMAFCLAGALLPTSTWAAFGVSAAPRAPFTPRANHQVLSFNNKLWVIGGYDGTARNDVWYSSDGTNWSCATTSASFAPRYDHSALVITDPVDKKAKMLVIAGNPGITTQTYPAYDGTLGTTVTITTTVVNSTTSGTFLNDAWSSSDGINWVQLNKSYNVLTKTTDTVDVFPNLARAGHASVVFTNPITNKTGIYVMGGLRKDLDISNPSNPQMVIAPTSDTWRSEDGGRTWFPLPYTYDNSFTARFGHGAIVFQNTCEFSAAMNLPNTIWVMGGQDGSRCLGVDPDPWDVFPSDTMINMKGLRAKELIYYAEFRPEGIVWRSLYTKMGEVMPTGTKFIHWNPFDLTGDDNPRYDYFSAVLSNVGYYSADPHCSWGRHGFSLVNLPASGGNPAMMAIIGGNRTATGRDVIGLPVVDADLPNDIWVSHDGMTWQKNTHYAFPTPRAYAGCAALNDGRYYLIGGNCATTVSQPSLLLNDAYKTNIQDEAYVCTSGNIVPPLSYSNGAKTYTDVNNGAHVMNNKSITKPRMTYWDNVWGNGNDKASLDTRQFERLPSPGQEVIWNWYEEFVWSEYCWSCLNVMPLLTVPAASFASAFDLWYYYGKRPGNPPWYIFPELDSLPVTTDGDYPFQEPWRYWQGNSTSTTIMQRFPLEWPSVLPTVFRSFKYDVYRAYVIGGGKDTAAVWSTGVYPSTNTANDGWHVVTQSAAFAVKGGRYGHSTVALTARDLNGKYIPDVVTNDDSMFLFCGAGGDGALLNDVWRSYATETTAAGGTWTKVTPALSTTTFPARMGHASVLFDYKPDSTKYNTLIAQEIWVLGGVTTNTTLTSTPMMLTADMLCNDVHAFKIDTDRIAHTRDGEHRSVGTFPTAMKPRAFFACTVVNDVDTPQLWVIGGRGPNNEVLKDTWYGTYNHDSGVLTWTQGPDLPEGRTDASAIFMGGRINVVGGCDETGVPRNDTFYLIPDNHTNGQTASSTGQWVKSPTEQTKNFSPRRHPGLVGGQTLNYADPEGYFIVGGANTGCDLSTSASFLNDIWYNAWKNTQNEQQYASYTAAPQRFVPPWQINFTDGSLGGITTRTWILDNPDLGGVTFTYVNPFSNALSHVFSIPGHYTISLLTSQSLSADGTVLSDTKRLFDYIIVDPPSWQLLQVFKNGNQPVRNIPEVITGPLDTVELSTTTLGGSPLVATVTLQNLGQTALDVYDISLPRTSAFIATGTLLQSLPISMAPQTTVTFQVVLNATGVGDYSDIVSISNNDPYREVYTFPVHGTIYPSNMQVLITSNTLLVPVPYDSGPYDMGTKGTTSTAIVTTFTVLNNGLAPIAITNPVLDPSTGFSIAKALGTSISALSSDTLVISFDANTIGVYRADIAIGTDQFAQNPFLFKIVGVVTYPGQPPFYAAFNTDLPSTVGFANPTFTYPFHDESVGTLVQRVWQFYDGVSTVTLVNPGLSFNYTFDVPATYTVSLTVTNPAGYTDTAVKTNYVVVLPRSTDPLIQLYDIDGLTLVPQTHGSAGDPLDLSTTTQGTPALTRTITIHNWGEYALNVSAIHVNSPFVITGLTPPVSLPALTTATFTVELPTSNTGIYNSAVTVLSNDPTNSADTFWVKGQILSPPDMLVYQEGVSSVTYGSGPHIVHSKTSTGPDALTSFTLFNRGTDLAITTITLANGYYQVVSSNTFPTTVSAMSSMTFQLALTTTTLGKYIDTVRIDTNMITENPFLFSVVGTVNTAGTLPFFALFTSDAPSSPTPAPVTVNFTDLSGGVIYQTVWSIFNGATTETLENPPYPVFSKTFDLPGNYTVSQTIYGMDSKTDTFAVVDCVKVLPSPTPYIVVYNGTDVLPSGGGVKLSSVTQGSADPVTTLTVMNWGGSTLNVTSINVDNPAFQLTTGSLRGIIPSLTSATFAVTLASSQAPGLYTGTISIATDDSAHSPYLIGVQALLLSKPGLEVRTADGTLFANAATPVHYLGWRKSDDPPLVTSFTLVNTGETTLTFTSATLPAGFEFATPLPPYILGNSTALMSIALTTNTVNPAGCQGQVALATDDPNSPYVFSILGFVTQQGVLSAPSAVEPTKGDFIDRIRVTWASVDGAGVYMVFRSVGSPDNPAAITGWITGNTYEDTDVVSKKTYYYWVVAAMNEFGVRKSSLSDSNSGWLGTENVKYYYKVTWSKESALVLDHDASTITLQVPSFVKAKPWIKIQRVKLGSKITPAPFTEFIETINFPEIIVQGSLDTFYSEAPIGTLRVSGFVTNVTTKNYYVKHLVAADFDKITMEFNPTSRSELYSPDTWTIIESNGNLTAAPSKKVVSVNLSGVGLGNFTSPYRGADIKTNLKKRSAGDGLVFFGRGDVRQVISGGPLSVNASGGNLEGPVFCFGEIKGLSAKFNSTGGTVGVDATTFFVAGLPYATLAFMNLPVPLVKLTDGQPNIKSVSATGDVTGQFVAGANFLNFEMVPTFRGTLGNVSLKSGFSAIGDYWVGAANKTFVSTKNADFSGFVKHTSGNFDGTSETLRLK